MSFVTFVQKDPYSELYAPEAPPATRLFKTSTFEEHVKASEENERANKQEEKLAAMYNTPEQFRLTRQNLYDPESLAGLPFSNNRRRNDERNSYLI